MGKKKGGSSGKGAANKPKPTKSPFAVASAKNKKKPKEVKSNLKKVYRIFCTNIQISFYIL